MATMSPFVCDISGPNMPTFLYRCPNTGFRVQGYTPEQTSDDGAYEVVTWRRVLARAPCQPYDR